MLLRGGTTLENLTPRQIVEELDRYIVGQMAAKRSVAIALRNRFRRRMLDEEFQEDILPKNILMMGPTGVGKTEIARRLARLVKAPFMKVEATKFTEVGYVGRDVESIIRDLLETAIHMLKIEKMAEVEIKAAGAAEKRLVNILAPMPSRKGGSNPFEMLFGSVSDQEDEGDREDVEREAILERRNQVREKLREGLLEDAIVEIEVEDRTPSMLEVFSGAGVEEMGINLQDVLGGMLPAKKKKRKLTVAEARKALVQEEAYKLIDHDAVVGEAIQRTEQTGIVFLDEIDKVAGREGGHGPDVSREGVQRDILPIVEGSTVMTKHGPVKSDHILFIGAGAFHVSKPSDLIPELQGRFPIRVELDTLSQSDFERILTEPENALTKQYCQLLETDGVNLTFTDDGVNKIAEMAYLVNEQTENIGARRLHTVLERLLEEVLFEAPDVVYDSLVIDAGYVEERLKDIIEDQDLSRYIL